MSDEQQLTSPGNIIWGFDDGKNVSFFFKRGSNGELSMHCIVPHCKVALIIPIENEKELVAAIQNTRTPEPKNQTEKSDER